MNPPNKSNNYRLPRWQSERMRTLIEERWTEVWEVVVARQRFSKNLHEHSRSSPHNSN